MFELGKTLSFFLSIFSLFPIVGSAFFVPGAGWEDRLVLSLLKVAVAACICFTSGLFFCHPSPADRIPGVRHPELDKPLTDRLLQTMPVRMFLWTLFGVAVMFLLSWFIEQYYIPLMWRNQPNVYGLMVRLLVR